MTVIGGREAFDPHVAVGKNPSVPQLWRVMGLCLRGNPGWGGTKNLTGSAVVTETYKLLIIYKSALRISAQLQDDRRQCTLVSEASGGRAMRSTPDRRKFRIQLR